MDDFEPRQERDSIPARRLLAVALAGLIVLSLAVIVSGTMLRKYRGARFAVRVPPPAGTVEQTLIDFTRRGLDYNQEKRKRLHELGWVDRQRGTARIPIDRAMDIVAAKQGAP